jgi:hypothetical protein
MPRDRHLCIVDYVVRPVADNEMTDCHEESRTISVTDQNGETSAMSYSDVGVKFGFDYSPRLQFLHEKEFREAPFYVVDVDNRAEDVFITGINSIEQDIAEGKICESLSIRHIGVVEGIDIGYGAFADSGISSGTLIGEYVGIMATTTEPTQYSLSYPSCTGGHEINASQTGNMIRFLNHSASPNASFRVLVVEQLPHVVCVAIRDVLAGEQVTVCYGAAFWHYHAGGDHAHGDDKYLKEIDL